MKGPSETWGLDLGSHQGNVGMFLQGLGSTSRPRRNHGAGMLLLKPGSPQHIPPKSPWAPKMQLYPGVQGVGPGSPERSRVAAGSRMLSPGYSRNVVQRHQSHRAMWPVGCISEGLEMEVFPARRLGDSQAYWCSGFLLQCCSMALPGMDFPVAQLVRNLPAMWETWVQSLGWEDPLEKEKATHSSILT